MKYLLDTHSLLWALTDKKRLSKNVGEICKDPETSVFASAIDFWEVSLKNFIGKLDIEEVEIDELPVYAQRMQIEILELGSAEASSCHQLTAHYHRHPFDRILIWQAISRNYVSITHDRDIKKYETEGLETV